MPPAQSDASRPASPSDAGPDAPSRPDACGSKVAKGARVLKGRTLDERRQERREALVDAALDLFGTKGYRSTSVEEICRHAHVSTRNFYEEFANREALLVELSEQLINQVFAALADGEPEPGPDMARRGARLRASAVVHALVDDPRVARVAFVESLGVSRELEARRRDAHRLFARWLVRRVADDLATIGVPDRNWNGLGLALVGAVNELICDWVLSEPRPPVDELVELIVDLSMVVLRRPQ